MAYSDNAEVTGTADEKFLATARKRFKAAKEYWDRIYGPARDDLKFFDGDQWPEAVERQRKLPGTAERPCLTINRLPQFHKQIVNDYRQSTISLRAQPQGAEDADTARTYQGLFRQIEKQSYAQLAYIMALGGSSIHGIGYFRILTDYTSDDSFDQDILIKRVTRPFTHYPDPEADEFFLEDANFWFVIEKLPKEEYKDLYGDDAADFDDDGEDVDWCSEGQVTIAEYFYFVNEVKTLVQLGNGDILDKKEADKLGVLGDVKRERTVRARKLHWAKIDGKSVLERREWAASRIPIVPVWGDELWIDEKRKLSGIVRPAKDSQRMYNYWQSAKTEMIALAPKAPYIAAEGQIAGHEDDWRAASITPKAVLTYKPISVDGHLVGAPQRQTYEAPVQAIIQASMQAADDMKATIGMYDASLGAKGNETSGIAIERRQREGDTATYHYVDNLAMSIGYAGTIISELIPIIYDTERQLRIIGEDGAMKTVTVNQVDENGNPVPGSPQLMDARYDLVLDTGPSFSTLRDETARTIVELSHNYPRLMEVAGDIAIGAMSFQGAREIAERLKRTVPPEVVGPDEDPVTKLYAAEQQLQQGKQVIEMLTAKVQEMEEERAKGELKLQNRSGELQIKRQELELKKMELAAKLAEAEQAAQNGEDASKQVESMAAVIQALMSLGSQIETMQDVIMEAIAEDDDAGEAAPEVLPEPEMTGTPEGEPEIIAETPVEQL